jgi:hypothetical protein
LRIVIFEAPRLAGSVASGERRACADVHILRRASLTCFPRFSLGRYPTPFGNSKRFVSG